MSFTDEDLKRLKEFRNKYQYFNFENAWQINEAYDLVEALLARLEAAERVVNQAKESSDRMDEIDTYIHNAGIGLEICLLRDAVRAWRKAAGK